MPAEKPKPQGPMLTVSKSFAALIKKNGPTASLVVRSPAWYQHQLQKYKDGEEVSLVITNKKPQRTEQQNRYWWVYMTHIGQETGHSPEEVHEWAKGMFLTSKIVNVFGQPTRIKGSTADLSKSEFSELIMKVEEESGIQAPPTESYSLSLEGREEHNRQYPAPLPRVQPREGG